MSQLLIPRHPDPTFASCNRSDNVPPYSGKEPSIKDVRQSKKADNVNEMVGSYQFKVDTRGAMLKNPIEGLSLVIPPGAVSLDNPSDIDIMKITIRHDMTSDFAARTGYIALSPTVTLDTNGLVFHKPVYLILPSYAVPNLSKLPDTKLVCSKTTADEPAVWQPTGDNSIVAFYAKHVVVKIVHFGHLRYVGEIEEQRSLEYVNMLVFASYQRDLEKVAIGVFVVNSKEEEEAKLRGREEYDELLTQVDFAVFTDEEAEQCVKVGICDLPVKMDPPFPQRPQEIPTLDIFNSAVRQVRVTIPMRDRQGDLLQSFECNVSLRQRGGLNRRIYITRDISRQDATPKLTSPVGNLFTPATSGGRNQPILQRYKTIPQKLKDNLKNSLTSENKKVLAVALGAHQNTDVDDLLFLWETMQGSTNMLTEMVNLFTNANCTNIAAVIEPYICES